MQSSIPGKVFAINYSIFPCAKERLLDGGILLENRQPKHGNLGENGELLYLFAYTATSRVRIWKSRKKVLDLIFLHDNKKLLTFH